MKRIFTLVVAVLCCAVVFAQANYSQHLMRNANRSMVSKKIEKPNKTREGEIWSCTFEEATPLYTAGQVIASDANWELQTLSEYDGGSWWWTLNSTSENHPYQALSDTPDHWMMINGEGYDITGYDFDSYLMFTGIDLTNAQYPQITFYEYRCLFNIPPSTEATVIEVSTNGGASWTRHIVGCESQDNRGFFLRRVPIFEAAGYEDVIIRFRANRNENIITNTYNGNPHYADGIFMAMWQVDDIVIEEAMPFDLVITDYRMNKGICDYYSNPNYSANYDYRHYHLRPMFGQTPRSEWTSENMFASFNVAVENRGSEDVEPVVNITITGPNGEEIWTVDFEGDLVGPYEIDTIDVIEYVGEGVDKVFAFTEEQMQNIALGEYTVTYTVSTEAGEDPTPANNTVSHHFYITESAYCPATPNITTTIGPNNWSDFTEGDEIVGMFEYYTLPDNEIPVYVFISENTNPGTAIAANIYEYNATTDDFELTVTSGTYTISENDLGKWINIPLESPLMLDEFDPEAQDKTIEVGIAFFENGMEELHLGASRDMPNKGWITRYNMGDGVTGINVTSECAAPAICLGDPTAETVTVATSEANEITMFPNPSNGIVNFTNVENATIEVYNMMGQVVASESNVSGNASIDLSGVANGNYIVRIVKDGEIATSKLNIVK